MIPTDDSDPPSWHENDIPMITLDDARGFGIEILVAEPRWFIVLDEALQKQLLGAVRACLDTAQIETATVTILLTDDDEMLHLNKTHRGIEAATDVLSFPALPSGVITEQNGLFLPDGEEKNPSPSGVITEQNGLFLPDGEEKNLGDIALAWGVVASEASASNTPLADHILHLLIHGVLHLLGFDHSDDDSAKIMEGLEVNILAAFNITNPYRAEGIAPL